MRKIVGQDRMRVHLADPLEVAAERLIRVGREKVAVRDDRDPLAKLRQDFRMQVIDPIGGEKEREEVIRKRVEGAPRGRRHEPALQDERDEVPDRPFRGPFVRRTGTLRLRDP
jgi:hypothetical protein